MCFYHWENNKFTKLIDLSFRVVSQDVLIDLVNIANIESPAYYVF